MKKLIHIMPVLFIAFAIVGSEGKVWATDEQDDNDQGSDDDDQGSNQSLCENHCNTDLAFEQAIRDRLLTGFTNWNMGYEAWLEWCDIVYEPDAHYNVYGQRLTLEEYKAMMGQFFQAFDIELGELDNIVVEGDWVAIRYTVYVTNKYTGVTEASETMEFAQLKNNPEPIGARVIEGWSLSGSPISP